MVRLCSGGKNPPLRKQILMNFGIAAVLMLASFIVISGVFLFRAGNSIVDKSVEAMEIQVRGHLAQSDIYAAEEFAGRLEKTRGTTQLLSEFTMDRISGYRLENWEDDRYVPFFDMESERNVYPLDPLPLPLDWNVVFNVNESNAEEHLQERASYLNSFSVSTASASYFFQGVCDPKETNRSSFYYLENCTDANNDIETGGIVSPSTENKYLYEKAAAIGALMKPLYEDQHDAVVLTVNFRNGGSGSQISMPEILFSGSPSSYESIGCDWLRETNPYTGRSLATEEEISKCRPKGSMVPQRHYNPLEREFCRNLVLNGKESSYYGPSVRRGSIPTFTVGNGVFDRLSGELIGCTAIEVALSEIRSSLKETIINKYAEASLVWYDGRTIVTTLQEANYPELENEFIYDTGFIDGESFAKLKLIVDFSEPWTFESITKRMRENVVVSGSKLYTVNPIPQVPLEYDPSYRPILLVIDSISQDVYENVTSLENDIFSDMRKLLAIVIISGVVGTMVAVLIVWYVSGLLTAPLAWMEKVTYSILHPRDIERIPSAVHHSSLGVYNPPPAPKLAPKTELSELVRQFRIMIRCFSGPGPAKPAHAPLREIWNDGVWSGLVLSSSRRGSTTDDRSIKKEESVGTVTTTEISLSTRPPREQSVGSDSFSHVSPAEGPGVHSGRNILVLPRKSDHFVAKTQFNPIRSSLFRWIWILIGIPVVISNIVIFSVIVVKVASEIPSWVDKAADLSLSLEQSAIQNTADRKAAVLQILLSKSVRNHHLYTRVAGLLLFGGLPRSQSFTKIHETTEECKYYSPDESCPFFESNSSVCACEWKDLNPVESCTSFGETYTRDLPERFFFAQARDADPNTGKRENASSFPEFDFSAETTLWWNSTSDLPGSYKLENASGYDTSYDRVRVTSPLGVVEFPIHNYAVSAGIRKHVLSTMIAFEIDGLCTGFIGCGYEYAYFSRFQSKEENGAFRVDPVLCPEGKFGYDPRCRSWYATGRRKYLDGGKSVHISPAYTFAQSRLVGSAVSGALANPASGEYLGQSLVGFALDSFEKILDRIREPIAFVVTTEGDEAGSDTFVRPAGTESIPSNLIGDLVLPYDPIDSDNRMFFDRNIVFEMRQGNSDRISFFRTDSEGGTEALSVAFSPVMFRAASSVDPADFSRGVSTSRNLVYSVGIAVLKKDKRKPFESVEEEALEDVRKTAVICLLMVLLVTALFLCTMFYVTMEISSSIIILLEIVESINEGRVGNSLTPLKGGCAEISQVYSAFAKLYKAIHISNTALFSGNGVRSYTFMREALSLFCQAEDLKAQGTIYNNLGNVFFVSSATEATSNDKNNNVCGVAEAFEYFDKAVEIAQRDFECCSDPIAKAEYAEQLADRLFNRAVLFLYVAKVSQDPKKSNASKSLGFDDLRRAKDLDYDTRNFWIEHQQLLCRSDEWFLRILQRLRGLTRFWDGEALESVWDTSELVEDANQLISVSSNIDGAPLFTELTPVGRRQQLESAVIDLQLMRGNFLEAGKLATRMLVEDEYILEEAFCSAADALLHVTNIAPEKIDLFWSDRSDQIQKAIETTMKRSKARSLQTGKNVVFALSVNSSTKESSIFLSIMREIKWIYNEKCKPYDRVAVVCSQEDSSTALLFKHKNDEVLLDAMKFVASSASEVDPDLSPFEVGLDMLTRPGSRTKRESFIFVIIDEYSWDVKEYRRIKWQIARTSKENDVPIHAILIGVDIRNTQIKEECKSIGTVSQESRFENVRNDNVHCVFQSLGTIVSGGDTPWKSLQCITIQKL